MARARPSLTVLLALILLAGCGDKKTKKTSGKTDRSGPSRLIVDDAKTPLRPLLALVPADARWAVLARRWEALRRHLAHTWEVIRTHPRFRPPSKLLKSAIIRRIGVWPLRPDLVGFLRLVPGSGGVVYQTHNGRTVLVAETRDLEKSLRHAGREVRRIGAFDFDKVRTESVGGRVVVSLGDKWSCQRLGRRAWCVDAPPGAVAQLRQEGALAGPNTASLLSAGPLASAAGRSYLRGDVGLYHGKPDDWPRGLRALLGPLTRQRPTAVWLSLSAPGPHVDVRALLLAPGTTAPPGDMADKKPAQTPEPFTAILGAGARADLVIRVRATPGRILRALGRVIPELAAAEHALQRSGLDLARALGRAVKNQLVVASLPEGIAALFPVRDTGEVQQFVRQLEVVIGPQSRRWQQALHGRGPGWGLQYRRESVAGVRAHVLEVQLPGQGLGAPLPLVRTRKLRLVWAATNRFLVAATSFPAFRRVLADAESPQARFLEQLPGPRARRLVLGDDELVLHWFPMDPLTVLQAPYVLSWQRAIARLPHETTESLPLGRVLLDLIGSITVALRNLPGAVGVRAVIGLPTQTAKSTTITPAYLRAAGKKYAGNTSGYWADLEALATRTPSTPASRKAARYVAAEKRPAPGGWLSVLTEVGLPLWRARFAKRSNAEAMQLLQRIVHHLHQLARRKQPTAGRLWHRPLRDTPITPVEQRCCKYASGTCPGSPKAWAHPTWQRLGFSLTRPHRYRAQLKFKKTGPGTRRVVVRVTGNLDCDAVFSVFQLTGNIDLATGRLSFGAPQISDPAE